MRYELYEYRDENTFAFLCEDDNVNHITQFVSDLPVANQRQYLVLDNEGGHFLVYSFCRTIPPKERRDYVFACKRCKFLCVNSRDIVLDWDTWLFRAFDEACAFAERETAAVFSSKKNPR